MRVYSAMLVVGLSFAASASEAQTRPTGRPTRSATIEGDVYLVMQNGDARRAAGQTISLLRESTITALDRLQICQRFRLATGPLLESLAAIDDTLKWYIPADRRMDLINRQTIVGKRLDTLRRAMRVEMNASIASMGRDTVGTGLAAHYKFPSVAPGSYVLHGSWSLGGRAYLWWAPITVRGGEMIKRDLDNSVEASRSVFCGV